MGASRKPQDKVIELTCKLIYLETLKILYTANTFDMRQSESLVRLPQVITPDHCQHIRSIRFSTVLQCPIILRGVLPSRTFPPDNSTKWLAACEVLAAFHHPETLDITLAVWSQIPSDRERADDETITTLLQPLQAVRAMDFSVTLAQTVPDELRAKLGSTPYRLIQRHRPGIGYYPDSSDD